MTKPKTCRNCVYLQRHDSRPFVCTKSDKKYYADVMRTNIDAKVCDKNYSGWEKRKSWIRRLFNV